MPRDYFYDRVPEVLMHATHWRRDDRGCWEETTAYKAAIDPTDDRNYTLGYMAAAQINVLRANIQGNAYRLFMPLLAITYCIINEVLNTYIIC